VRSAISADKWVCSNGTHSQTTAAKVPDPGDGGFREAPPGVDARDQQGFQRKPGRRLGEMPAKRRPGWAHPSLGCRDGTPARSIAGDCGEIQAGADGERRQRCEPEPTELARRIGVSRRTLERAMRDAAAAGALVMDAGRSGTRLALA
jgi:hypothetical protein